jgi:PAS domain S-box-containing protein
VIDCNKAFLEDLKMRKEEVIGKTCYEVLHHIASHEDCISPGWLCPVEETLLSGRHTVTEHVHYQKDGGRIYVEVSAYPIKDENEEITQIVHVSRNITERKLKEEEYRKEIKELKRQMKKTQQKKRQG